MKAEIQNQLWAILPKEARVEVKVAYGIDTINKHFDNSYNTALIDIFGLHNLTSDTKPEEMLVVERKKVQDLYSTMDKAFPRETAYCVQESLKSLFGDKCLPDKDISKMETTEQPISKFSIGQKVVYTCDNGRKEVGEIAAYFPDEKFCYSVRFGKEYHNMAEHQLEPYTEENKETIKMKTLEESLPEAGKIIEDNFWDWIGEDYEEKQELNKIAEEISDGLAEQILKPIKKYMEEKELNLCELLAYQDLSGTYSPIYGEVRVTDIACDGLVITSEHSSDNNIELFPDGRFSKNGDCLLYPSLALYEKYPLDPYSAWMEWKESRQPKRWRAKKGERYWVVDSVCEPVSYQESNVIFDDDCYKVGNYFRTEEEAEEATKLVKETLLKFHEDKLK
ncbi:MAG: hypothetical protein K2H32_09320 [Muribaculaceae bacterium]|nr:hypothetical protein [Muribaculaceae bacterium]